MVEEEEQGGQEMESSPGEPSNYDLGVVASCPSWALLATAWCCGLHLGPPKPLEISPTGQHHGQREAVIFQVQRHLPWGDKVKRGSLIRCVKLCVAFSSHIVFKAPEMEPVSVSETLTAEYNPHDYAELKGSYN